ncbi:MAG: flagellar hook-basal body complex protein [Devosia sp.]
MGIYGALSTAVTGLQAQSYALENISGNIANSQTIGYKRIDTSFQDMIPDDSPQSQVAGSVVANALATNNVAGDISSSQTATNMAINGNGFFVVQQKTGTADGHSVFSGATYYTRRGDFQLDKDGHLVNGAGYYLEGLPIDASTGNVSGSVPSVVTVSNALLPALPTTKINYQLNLPQMPQDPAYQASVPGSELLKTGDFLPTTITTPATATGSTTLTGAAAASTAMPAGSSLTVTVNGTPKTFDFYTGAYTGTNTGIDVTSADINTVLGQIQSALQGLGGSTATATAGLNTSGKVAITLGSNLTDSLTVADTTPSTTGLGLGSQTVAATGPVPPGPVNSISAADNDKFLSESISGGAITVYSSNGAPANVQLQWAKTSSAATGGTDTWNLYYLSNSSATNGQTMWTNAGVNYTFAADGSMSPAITSTTIPNMTVNGIALGNVTLDHGTNGVTQFADSNGSSSVTALTQNGYAAGKFTSVAVNDSGRVVASYSNGIQIAVAQVVTANFNGANSLKQLNGDAYAETSESGSPVLSTDPTISGSSLEASNTDISSEFSKLIVTQQAYAAGTKIVTTANDMLQQALNMIR